MRHLFTLFLVACSVSSSQHDFPNLDRQAPAESTPPVVDNPPPGDTRYARPPQLSAPPTHDEPPLAEARRQPTAPQTGRAGPTPSHESAAPPVASSDKSDGEASARGSSAKPLMPVPDRPGLGTSWGETRYSHVNETPFQRAAQAPTFSGSLWYNDRQGADAMARSSTGYATSDRATLTLARGLVVALRDEGGSVLPGYRSGNRTYAIGEAGRRYTLIFENRTATRFELVASVDGLDVIDGRAASFGKRGYIVDAYSMVEIDGFRQSNEQVAAFRFGSVRGSYAKLSTGSDKNVGVIGAAIFAERTELPYWSSRDVDRRQQADPFPGRYAPELYEAR